jgi:hypothetical protein
MTIDNKNWLKNEVFRMYLSADSQETIAKNLSISVGTVNSIINEISKSDVDFDMLRQIAIISKKNGVSYKQMAANLRFKNEVTKACLDDRKVEKFLDAIDALCNKYGLDPKIAANTLYSLIETMLRENIDPNTLDKAISAKNIELQEIDSKIVALNESLHKAREKVEKEKLRLEIEEKNLEQFKQISRLLDVYDSPEISSEYGNVVRAMIDFKGLGYDPKLIVSKYERVQTLTSAIATLELRLQKSEKVLKSYSHIIKDEENRWKGHFDTIRTFEDLMRAGLRKEDIFTTVDLIKRDFPGNSISHIFKDLHTYGSLAAATWKMEREEDAKNAFLL